MFKLIKKVLLLFLMVLGFGGLSSLLTTKAEAYTYSVSLPKRSTYVSYDWSGGTALGYNRSQGYAQNLTITISNYTASINVPDDGSTWDISGIVNGSAYYETEYIYSPSYVHFSTTITTSGVFSGYSPKTATDAANTAANYALQAKSSADTAASKADQAKASADTAALRVWDSSESKSAATLAKEARNYAQTATNNTTYNSQSAAYWAYLSAQNTAPEINRVQGQNGATCTTGTSFMVVISATPSSGASYRVTCGMFDSGWVSSNTITITGGIVSGANTAIIQVKNSLGTTAQTAFTFFKI
ncbi:MAG TPA: hypothetical protein PK728_04985 [Bacillota bacterium]|nr:hypothetical protein [Bacillota bacterium]